MSGPGEMVMVDSKSHLRSSWCSSSDAWPKNLCSSVAAMDVSFTQWRDGESTGWRLQTPLNPIWRLTEMPSGGRAALAEQSGLRRGQLEAFAILKKDLQPKAGLTRELPSGTTCRMNIIAWAFKKIEIHLSMQVGLLLRRESSGTQWNKYWCFAKQR